MNTISALAIAHRFVRRGKIDFVQIMVISGLIIRIIVIVCDRETQRNKY